MWYRVVLISLQKISGKNTSILTDEGWRQARFLFTMCPAVLKALSDGTEVAGIDKYFFCQRWQKWVAKTICFPPEIFLDEQW